MICMHHVHSNVSVTAKLGVLNSQFYRFWRLCCSKDVFISEMVSLIFLLKNKGYLLKIMLKRTRGLLSEEKFLFGISAFGVFQMILYSLVSGELLISSLGLCFSLLSFSVFFSLWCCLFLASSMAESSRCFQICRRNSVCRLVFTLALPTVGS